MHLHWNECTWYLLCGSSFVFEQRLANEVVDSLIFHYSDIFASSLMQWKSVQLKPATELNATKQIPTYIPLAHFLSPTTADASMNWELILLTEQENFFICQSHYIKAWKLVDSNYVRCTICMCVYHSSRMRDDNSKIGLASPLKHCKNWIFAAFSESQGF